MAGAETQTEYRMPSLGADMKEGRVVEWHVRPGDTVHRGDVIGVVDTDKGAIEIEIWEDAVIDEIVVGPGAEVPVGEVLLRLHAPDAGTATASKPEAVKPESAKTEAVPSEGAEPETVKPLASSPEARAAAGTEPAPPDGIRASPAARQEAHRQGVDLERVTGTGPDGAVVLADVLNAAGEVGAPERGAGPEEARARRHGPRATPVARRAAEALGVDLASVTGTGSGGIITRRDVEGMTTAVGRGAAQEGAAGEGREAMRSAIAAAMARSKREIPHYYLGTSTSARATLEWLARENRDRPPEKRLLVASVFLKAVAAALHEFPELNGRWVDGAYRPAPGVHPGLAISLRGGGLVAPAIHDADRMSLEELSAAVTDLVSRARGGRLRGSEMTDSTITVSSMGDRGVDTIFGVIYPPQVALVGIGRITERPWAEHGMVGVHPVVNISLSGDHRVSDGHRGGLFLQSVADLIQQPEDL